MESKIIDHLGLVSGMWDELEVTQIIDNVIPQDATYRNISIGNICKALVLNGLGFTERTLYMVSQFFDNKPTSLLLGKDIKSSHLNDTVIGRALDAIQHYGTSRLFSQITPKVVSKLNLSPTRIHMDSTDFHVDGVYNSDNKPEEGSSTVFITKGYSRDHRADLNQVVLNLITDNKAGIPLHMEVLNGNISDKSIFKKTINQHINSLQNIAPSSYMVMDSAGYTKKGIAEFSSLTYWISRVPESIKTAKELMIAATDWKKEGKYQYSVSTSFYGEIEQRWLLVFSEEAFKKEVKTLIQNYSKLSEKECKNFKKLSKESFICQEDAEKALAKFEKATNHIVLTNKNIRNMSKQKRKPNYKITATITCSIDDYKKQEKTKGKFIIATNQMDKNALPDVKVIEGYKEQVRVERGFRFIKDPQFVARNFFVKKPERLEALVFIMTLCLTVYAAIEHRIRKLLKDKNETIRNQIGKQVQNPTTRWVFQLFTGIHLLVGIEKEVVLNVKEIHLKILKLMEIGRASCRERV